MVLTGSINILISLEVLRTGFKHLASRIMHQTTTLGKATLQRFGSCRKNRISSIYGVRLQQRYKGIDERHPSLLLGQP